MSVRGGLCPVTGRLGVDWDDDDETVSEIPMELQKKMIKILVIIMKWVAQFSYNNPIRKHDHVLWGSGT